MKNQWNQFPFVLRRKILLTFLAGLASIALSLIIFIITTDHILLVLGSIIFLASLVLVRSLWSTTARGQYEIVEGVCSSVISPVIRRYRKIQLIDGQGAERTLLLSKSAKFQIGARYRFYFQTGSRPWSGMTIWTRLSPPTASWDMRPLVSRLSQRNRLRRTAKPTAK